MQQLVKENLNLRKLLDNVNDDLTILLSQTTLVSLLFTVLCINYPQMHGSQITVLQTPLYTTVVGYLLLYIIANCDQMVKVAYYVYTQLSIQ